MATNNSINAPLPLSATQGGLGLASPTAHGILIAEGSAAVTPIVLTAGQVLIGTTSGDPSATTLTAGTGITITSSSGSITISRSSGSDFTWSAVTNGASVIVAANNGYYVTTNAQASFTLSGSTLTPGQVFAITSAATNSGGWHLSQGASQSVTFGNTTTTPGTSGSLIATSTTGGDTIYVLCVATNSFVVTGAVGNLTVV